MIVEIKLSNLLFKIQKEKVQTLILFASIFDEIHPLLLYAVFGATLSRHLLQLLQPTTATTAHRSCPSSSPRSSSTSSPESTLVQQQIATYTRRGQNPTCSIFEY